MPIPSSAYHGYEIFEVVATLNDDSVPGVDVVEGTLWTGTTRKPKRVKGAYFGTSCLPAYKRTAVEAVADRP